MESKHWETVVELFHQLHAKSDGERTEWLEDTRITNPELALELERMLAEENASDGFLENSPLPRLEWGQEPVRVGEVVGRYQILSLLGGGGMGIVYRARDSQLNRCVALKFLAPHLVGYGRNRAQFLKEAQAAAALQHPNVCPIYEIAEHRGTTYIVMALLEGQTLAQRIEAGPLPVKEAVGFALDAAAGLQAAHSKNIIHRDIKPGNLMVTAGSDLLDHVTLMDFGLAQMTGESRSASGPWLAGSVCYISPERIAGSAVDQRTDLWSLGVVLFEMLTGQKPFRGGVDIAVLNAITHSQPEAPSRLRAGIPVALDRFVAKALAKDPEQRYGTAGEMIHDLRMVAATLGTGNGAVASGTRSSRRRVVLAMTALVLLFAGALGTVYWKRRGTTELHLRQLTLQIADDRVTTAAVSPNGKLLAYATVDGIFLQVMRTRETHLLRSPPDFWVDKIRWFVDGDKLIVGGIAGANSRPEIWVVSVLGGAPRLFRADARSPELSQDNTQVAFTSGSRSEIWISGVSGQDAR
ncbi:MAG TPA: protein kinase, partial [Bryobacteraceae bacterium]